MGRKSLAEPRRAQILEAFERVVGEVGLEAATLERVAREAGLKRQLIGHYFGTRDQLVQAAVRRMLERYRLRIDDAASALPAASRIEAILDHLLAPDGEEIDLLELRDQQLMSGLRARLLRDPEARQLVHEAFESFRSRLAAELGKHCPEASARSVDDAAFSVMALTLATWEAGWVGFGQGRYRAARHAAEAIVASLRDAPPSGRRTAAEGEGPLA